MIFKNAHFDDLEHRSFTLDVELNDGCTIPFTYLCDGSDDASGEIAQSVGDAYRAGQIEVSEYVEVMPTREELAECARIMRNDILNATDYLTMPDYPITTEQRAELTAYRQALRDISDQIGFPESIEWPQKPDWIK